MANSKSSRKRAVQSEKRRSHNSSLRATLRTSMKKINYAISDGNTEVATEAYKKAQPLIDRMASKGIIHKATAARYKSRLNAQVKKLTQAAA